MNKQLFKLSFLVISLTAQTLFSLTITRAIVSTDTNPTYIDFWPVVAKAWKKLIGVQPTLALIAPADVEVDETLGDVIRFEPIPGVPTAQQAQVIRLLLPAYFEDEGVILSDIDMLPISKEYLLGSVTHLPEDSFVVYRDQAYGKNYPQYPMCYVAGQGKTFKELFKINSVHDITRKIVDWYGLGYGWMTDEKVMFNELRNWKYAKTRFIKLGHSVGPRIDRSDWRYDLSLLHKGFYIDSHMVRPYRNYKEAVDNLASQLGLD